MRITVILCTYNRWQSLARALESASALKLPGADRWEILVVDNNSTDKTREVVENFCRRYPGRFRYLFEPRQGKSHALNAGIREAHADVLAFMDDDVTVDPEWLRNLTASLRADYWAGAGGRILPQQTFRLPPWLSLSERYALGPLALFDLGSDTVELFEAPFGTNMAFRRGMFDKHGGFRTDLGPRPGSEIRSEDSATNTRPSSIMQFRKAVYKKGISSTGGLTKLGLTLGHVEIWPGTNGTSRGFRSFCFAG
jgi:glycosyltransferase involved in cell wall biosynthesis